ncbi:MAG TPA: hypothetical protein VIS72_10500 [Anaerolineales bacterium]
MGDFIQILGVIGFLIRALGFLVAGYALGKFTFDSYGKANWQLQIALALGFFGLLIGLTAYTSPASSGMFALGGGAAFLMATMPKKNEDKSE